MVAWTARGKSRHKSGWFRASPLPYGCWSSASVTRGLKQQIRLGFIFWHFLKLLQKFEFWHQRFYHWSELRSSSGKSIRSQSKRLNRSKSLVLTFEHVGHSKSCDLSGAVRGAGSVATCSYIEWRMEGRPGCSQHWMLVVNPDSPHWRSKDGQGRPRNSGATWTGVLLAQLLLEAVLRVLSAMSW